jgi:hypothetical protein
MVLRIPVIAAAGLLLVACGTAPGSASHSASNQPATVQAVQPVAPIAIDQAAAPARNGSPAAKPNTSQPADASARPTTGSRSLEPAEPVSCGPSDPAQPNLHKLCPG